MQVTVQDTSVELPNVSEEKHEEIRQHLESQLSSDIKKRRAICNAFQYAISQCPNENISDLWHHIIYRSYLDIDNSIQPGQSWVRTSGEALELFFAEYYNDRLPDDLRLTALIDDSAKSHALEIMNISGDVGEAKLDLVFKGRHDGSWHIFGGGHSKASLAERVSDDVPTSQVMMENGYWSVLMTLDVKSFPPPHGDLVNRGELGSPEDPSEKRKYIENQGKFSNAYSYNERTTPSNETTPSGSKIFTITVPQEHDKFIEDLTSFWHDFKNTSSFGESRMSQTSLRS